MTKLNLIRRGMFRGFRVVHLIDDNCEDCDSARRRDVASICTFGEEAAEEIRYLREQPRPPRRWIYFIGGAIESRAWIEWRRYHKVVSPYDAAPGYLREVVIERDGYVCGICGGEVTHDGVDIDHIVPWSRGGPTVVENLRVAHRSCNRKRRNREERFLDVTTGRWHNEEASLNA